MLESREISASTSKILLLALVALAGCARDKLAPDCFQPDPEGSGCLIPFPGASEVTGNCESGDAAPPDGAVGATYTYDLNDAAIGGTGVYSNWSTSTPLPPGLTLDADTGIISGVPEGPGNTGYPLSVSVDDALTGESYTFDCAEIHINDRLNAMAVRNETNHCIPHTMSVQQAIDAELIQGGDGTDITCNALNVNNLPCPLGDGNGRLAPGVTFNETSCSHSGDVTGDRRGTWVWMVEVVQSGAVAYVPYCASNDVDAFHDITLTANAQQEPDLTPGLLEYDPGDTIEFGNNTAGPVDGTHQWDVQDPQCNSDPSQCNSFGFKFDVTCSPFDPPFVLDAESTGVGIHHDLGAAGPANPTFAERPWVASFEMLYCTSANGVDCDVNDANFEQNAQTQYHYDIVAFPVLGNP